MYSAIIKEGNLWGKSEHFASLTGQELTALQGGGPSFTETPFRTSVLPFVTRGNCAVAM